MWFGLLAWGHETGSAQGSSDSTQLCGDPIVRDYEKPFGRMPSLHAIPKSGNLNFIPTRSHIRAYSLARPVVVGEGGVGFGFIAEDPGDPVSHLGWRVDLELSQVDIKGRVVKSIRTVTRKIESTNDLRKLQLWVPLSPQPKFYRARLAFATLQGRHLAAYGQYARVVRPTHTASLRASGDAFQPDEPIEFRLENYGTETVRVFPGYHLERLEGNSWTAASANSQPKTRARLQVLYAGEATGCERLEVPSDLQSGSFRLRKEIEWSSGNRHQLYATFEVR
jgi:hypothetical protein